MARGGTRWHAVARGGTRWHAVARGGKQRENVPTGGSGSARLATNDSLAEFLVRVLYKTIAKFGASRPELDPYQWAGTVYFRVSTTKKQFSWMHDKNVCYE